MNKRLEKRIATTLRLAKQENLYRPLVFDLHKLKDEKRLAKLFTDKKILEVIDNLPQQQEELGIVVNPRLLNNRLAHKTKARRGKLQVQEGVWVYYPWRGLLVHCLREVDFDRLRLSRNHNLITLAEQRRLAKFKVGIAGLNVGNPVALCLALTGVGSIMKLADNDILSVSNLNRFRAGLPELGLNKAILTARQIYELNPYANIKVFNQGIETGKEEKFLLQPKVDLLIEEMDNMPLKLSIRLSARRLRIPVLMVTGNGANVIIDVERFDLHPRQKLLNGLLPQRVINNINSLSPRSENLKERVLLARDFIGIKFLVERLQKSFVQVGARLAGIPQLAETSFLRGAVLGYFTRQLALGNKLPSGRYQLKMDNIIKKRK